MNAIAQKSCPAKFQPTKVKPNIIHIPKEQWKANKKPMFQWAENICAKLGIKANYLNILKVIISLTDSKGVTYATLETIRNRLIQLYGKAAPSRQTIDRAIHKLCTAGLLKRDPQETYKGLVRTRILRYKSAMRSTSKRGTEYISPKRYIYGEEVIAQTSASPSISKSIFQKKYHKTASAPALGATALAVCHSRQEERKQTEWMDEELAARIKLMEEVGMLNDENLALLRSQYAVKR